MTLDVVNLEQRVQRALDAEPSRIPLILGGCGTGRTSQLRRMSAALGPEAQYIDVERCATTPERFLAAVTSASPFAWAGPEGPPESAREAFDRLLHFFTTARTADGGPCTFLLDEVLELRVFSSFPGLRHVLADLTTGLAASSNQFVLTSRYPSRARRVVRDVGTRFEVIDVEPLAVNAIIAHLAPTFNHYEQMPTDDRDYLGRATQALTGGRAVYVHALAEQMGRMDNPQPDPISALTALMARDGALTQWCRYCYEMRLQHARGYGALKAILEILALDEPLTLTAISLQLHRTPGSTKDYLSWLEDVDLVTCTRKRYSFADPMLRLWVRAHCRPTPPSDADVAAEVQRYALARVPPPTALAYAGAGTEATPEERRSWGIIEID